MSSDLHNLKTNDKWNPMNKMLHVPGYVAATLSEMASITTMATGDDCFVTAVNTVYRYNGTWKLIGPTFGPNVILRGKYVGAASPTATISGGVCTVSHTAHGYSTGDVIVPTGSLSGSTGDFQQLHVITVTDADHYTFATTGTGTVSSLVERFWFSGARSSNAGLVKNISRAAPGDYVVTFTNTQTDAFYGIGGSASNSSNPVTMYISSLAPISTTQFEVKVIGSGGTVQDADAYLNLALTGVI